MNAAVLDRIGGPLSIEDVEYPICGVGQVLVKVLMSGICGAQLQEIDGHKGNASYCPHMLGHEGCGMVLKTGPGVKNTKVGDKVVMHWRKGAGIEAEAAEYKQESRIIRGGMVTTFNEFAVVSENRVTAIPIETPNEFAAMLGCGLSTALGTIESEAKLRMGESLLIVGCGGLGLNLISAGRFARANPIHCIDIFESKRSSAISIGADEFHCKYGPNRKFDVIVDTTGAHLAIETTLPLLASGGRYIMVGQPKPNTGFAVWNARHLFDGQGKSIIATQGGRFQPHVDIPRWVALHQAGILKVDGIVSHRIELDEINKGIKLVRDGQAGRVMIEMP